MGLTSSASVLVGTGGGTGVSEVWDAFARKGSRAGLEDLDEEDESVREKRQGKEMIRDSDRRQLIT